MKNQTDFSSRISIRAVTAGVMTSISFMMLSMTLFAALGIWNYNLNELSQTGSIFWISITIAWCLSLYLAGYIASIGSRSENNIEGILNALAACCGAYIVFGVSFLLFAPGALDILLNTASPQFFLKVFLGDIFSFAAGIYGGVSGSHFEERSVNIKTRSPA
jgi:hypothetical protein